MVAAVAEVHRVRMQDLWSGKVPPKVRAFAEKFRARYATVPNGKNVCEQDDSDLLKMLRNSGYSATQAVAILLEEDFAEDSAMMERVFAMVYLLRVADNPKSTPETRIECRNLVRKISRFFAVPMADALRELNR